MLGVEQELEAHIRLIKEQEATILKATSNTNPDPVPSVTEDEVLREPQKKVSRGQSRKRIKSSFEIDVQKNSLTKGDKVDKVIVNQIGETTIMHQQLQVIPSQTSMAILTNVSAANKKPRIYRTCGNGGHDTRNFKKRKDEQLIVLADAGGA
ncbi:hypothetical protein MKX03_015303 [Papaver bracteatum]|nr:hypothetical protein MKX03_015303 [Papaver bracteatum]